MGYLKLSFLILAMPFVFAFYLLVLILVFLYGKCTGRDVLEA